MLHFIWPEVRALWQDHPSGLHHPAAHEQIDELGAEVGLADLEQLLPQNHSLTPDVDHVAVEKANVLVLVALRDQREEIRFRWSIYS